MLTGSDKYIWSWDAVNGWLVIYFVHLTFRCSFLLTSELCDNELSSIFPPASNDEKTLTFYLKWGDAHSAVNLLLVQLLIWFDFFFFFFFFFFFYFFFLKKKKKKKKNKKKKKKKKKKQKKKK